MKTVQLKSLLLFCGLSILNVSNAQCLLVKGKVCDEKGQKIEAEYVLKTTNSETGSGIGKDIKLKLYFSTNYTLTIKKEGYETKYINFVTYVESNRNYNFNFEVALKKATNHASNRNATEVHVGDVYYDSKLREFNARVY